MDQRMCCKYFLILLLLVPTTSFAKTTCPNIFGFDKAFIYLQTKYQASQLGWVRSTDPGLLAPSPSCGGPCVVNLAQATRKVMGDELLGDPVRVANEVAQRFPDLEGRSGVNLAEFASALRWVMDRQASIDVEVALQVLEGTVVARGSHMRVVKQMDFESLDAKPTHVQVVSYFAVNAQKQIVGGNVVQVVGREGRMLQVINFHSPEKVTIMEIQPIKMKAGLETFLLVPALGGDGLKLIVNGIGTVKAPQPAELE